MFFMNQIRSGLQKLCEPVRGVLVSSCGMGQPLSGQGRPYSRPSDILGLLARQILDSRGHPTVEVDLTTDQGLFRASVPSGTSVGLHEALELRDKDRSLFHGMGVMKAVKVVNKVIAPELTKHRGFRLTWQGDLDAFLVGFDGTNTRSRLGANAMLAVSMAFCKAGAAKKGVPLYQHIADLSGNTNIILPTPAFNVINGGLHAGNRLAVQDFQILPTGAATFSEAVKMGTEVYHHLREVIEKKLGRDSTAVGYEGGFVPRIHDTKEALNLIQEAIEKAGYTGKIELGIDVAASVFCKREKYNLDFKNPQAELSAWHSPDQLIDLYQDIITEFPICSIEDPFDQNDWPEWTRLTAAIPDIQIVGDDLTCTNSKIIQRAVDWKECNCLSLKLNQVGTVTEGVRAHLLAKANGWSTQVSHRSGETEDTFIADLAVGLGTGQIKAGAPRSERMAKYNQLLRIEEELGTKARFAGKCFRYPD